MLLGEGVAMGAHVAKGLDLPIQDDPSAERTYPRMAFCEPYRVCDPVRPKKTIVIYERRALRL
jgi:hypothetical protein